jgi:hypothetical protein
MNYKAPMKRGRSGTKVLRLSTGIGNAVIRQETPAQAAGPSDRVSVRNFDVKKQKVFDSRRLPKTFQGGKRWIDCFHLGSELSLTTATVFG